MPVKKNSGAQPVSAESALVQQFLDLSEISRDSVVRTIGEQIGPEAAERLGDILKLDRSDAGSLLRGIFSGERAFRIYPFGKPMGDALATALTSAGKRENIIQQPVEFPNPNEASDVIPVSTPAIELPLAEVIVPPITNDRLTELRTNFAGRLLAAILPTYAGDNISVAPKGVFDLLAILAKATAGETQKEIMTALGAADISIDALVGALKLDYSAQDKSNQNSGVKVTEALGLWANGGLRDDFVKLMEDLGATLKCLSDGVDNVNQWVSQVTQGKITEILKQLDPESFGIFVHALAFDGKWKEGFVPKYWNGFNRDGSFQYVASNSPLRVLFEPTEIFLSRDYSPQVSDWRWAEIPYADGVHRLLVAMLPNRGRADRNAPPPLTTYMPPADIWQKALDQFKIIDPNSMEAQTLPGRLSKAKVVMPEMKIDTTVNLMEALRALKISRLTHAGRADFSGMLNSGAVTNTESVSNGVQRVTIEFTREGTQVAAATAFELTRGGGDEPEFVIDGPFAYQLLGAGNTLVASGIITNPVPLFR